MTLSWQFHWPCRMAIHAPVGWQDMPLTSTIVPKKRATTKSHLERFFSVVIKVLEASVEGIARLNFLQGIGT